MKQICQIAHDIIIIIIIIIITIIIIIIIIMKQNCQITYDSSRTFTRTITCYLADLLHFGIVTANFNVML